MSTTLPATETTSIDLWGPRILSVLRIVAGLLFIEHGTQKLLAFPVAPPFPLPTPFSLLWVGAIIEALGGLLVALGLFTRPAAFIMSGEMAVAYFLFHAPHGFFPLVNGGEDAILFCFVFLFIAAAGPGPWSLDRTLRR